MGQETVDLVVPADLADILIDEGLARQTIERRSSIILMLAEGASMAISLLQGPSTVMQVARGIRRWAEKHRENEPGSDELTIVSSQHIEIRVNADTSIERIAVIVQATMVAKDEPKPPEDFDGLTI